MSSLEPGTVSWVDLTVVDAVAVRDFYEAVIGWRHEGVGMGGYEDFAMKPPGQDGAVTGICHARGANATLPAQWLIYITVADLDQSMNECVNRGGKVVVPSRTLGKGRYCVIQDPAGAVCALFQEIE